MRDERRAQRLRQRMVLAKLDDQMWQKIVPDDETEIDKFDFVYRVLVQLEVRGPCVCVRVRVSRAVGQAAWRFRTLACQLAPTVQRA